MNPYDELHAYVDGELSDADRHRIDGLIGSDEDLARRVEAIRSLKAAVASNAPLIECRESWRACQARLTEIDRARRTERFVGRNAWAICACFGIAIFGAGWWHKANAPKTMQNADFVQAVAGFGGSHSSDQSKYLNHYMDALLHRARAVQSSNAILVGEPIHGVMDGHRFVKMRLTDKSGDMWIVGIEDEIAVEGLTTSESLPGFGLGKLGSMNCVQYVADGHTMLLAGDREYAELARVMNRVCATTP